MSENQSRRVRPDEMIFRENDPGDCAYLIERGRVLIFINKEGTEVPLRILNKGEVFGEMSIIDGSPRSASCRAVGDVQLLLVTKTQLMDRISAADPVVRLLMQALLDRLRAQNDRLRGIQLAGMEEDSEALDAEKKEALERIGLENRISTGLDNDEFLPFYQPIYDLATCDIIGCEALIRWLTKEKGIIPPGVFMDLMEDSSLILRAGQMIIEKSAADLAELSGSFSGTHGFFISVNVSGRQFMDPGFIEHLERVRRRLAIQASQIKLELTERIMTEGKHALDTLQECRKLGYQLAIDDFGTGFSSLQYLAQMPITHLKIDRAFVMNLFKDSKSLMIVKSLIHMADILGLELIAEGIETREQLELLKSLGVRMGQGFLFCKPIPLTDFMKLPTRHKM